MCLAVYYRCSPAVSRDRGVHTQRQTDETGQWEHMDGDLSHPPTSHAQVPATHTNMTKLTVVHTHNTKQKSNLYTGLSTWGGTRRSSLDVLLLLNNSSGLVLG